MTPPPALEYLKNTTYEYSFLHVKDIKYKAIFVSSTIHTRTCNIFTFETSCIDGRILNAKNIQQLNSIDG